MAGAAGVAAFYKALSLGTMSVVAPITGLLSAALPVLAGLGRGERPEPVALVGIAIALLAIVLVSREAAGANAGDGSAAGARRSSRPGRWPSPSLPASRSACSS